MSMLRRMLHDYVSSGMIKVKGYCLQDGVPSPDNMVPIQTLGREYEFIDLTVDPFEVTTGAVYSDVTANSLKIYGSATSTKPTVCWKLDITGSKTMHFSCKSTKEGKNGGGLIIIEKIPGADLYPYQGSDILSPDISFSITENCQGLYLYFHGSSSSKETDVATFSDVRLVCMDSAKTTELLYTFNVIVNSDKVYDCYVASPLAGLGDNNDYIDNWGNVVRKVGMCTIDPASPVTALGKTTDGNYRYSVSQITSGFNEEALCTHFVNISNSVTNKATYGTFCIRDNENIVFVSNISTAEAFVQWLEENQVQLYYKLANDVSEPGYTKSIIVDSDDVIISDDPNAEIEAVL